MVGVWKASGIFSMLVTTWTSAQLYLMANEYLIMMRYRWGMFFLLRSWEVVLQKSKN